MTSINDLTSDQLDALVAERDQLSAALDRVRALHTHGRLTNACNDCGQLWPCETARALADTEAAPAPGATEPGSCGIGHARYPELHCNQPAGHDGPHAAPFRETGAAAWDGADVAPAATEAPGPVEHCGRTTSMDGTEYPPCARPAGHTEAYCRSASRKAYFLTEPRR